jgi:hypothetical protein
MTTNSTSTTTTTTTISAYRFAKLANEVIVEAGLPELPPQMFYTYLRKGMIGTSEAKPDNTPMTEEGAKAWAEAYVPRKRERLASAEAKRQAELAGDTDSTTDTKAPKANAKA